jgi:selenocysteine lyase/cysteine desulfurase
VKTFLNAAKTEEVVFVRGTTEETEEVETTLHAD